MTAWLRSKESGTGPRCEQEVICRAGVAVHQNTREAVCPARQRRAVLRSGLALGFVGGLHLGLCTRGMLDRLSTFSTLNRPFARGALEGYLAKCGGDLSIPSAGRLPLKHLYRFWLRLLFWRSFNTLYGSFAPEALYSKESATECWSIISAGQRSRNAPRSCSEWVSAWILQGTGASARAALPGRRRGKGTLHSAHPPP